ncbi:MULTISPECIES: NosD domain-containing protein [unclassified Curtobacterium]|uniref:NosD domain-containing protein n=1 Tax=unclassified Curtobacterium TaxID=257496 RepID=UPI000D87B72E|nr:MULTISPECIES: NosD domain-containing protein [unclassified Curtobacterium]PYY39638.1 right-handed parallel beta-helix repeat-containing protein [Curtobacterium sp. MCPF17_046]WIB17117.1 right-handed parallel beta-helix repeat-containing protein [Curtobacterium sp. MCPF17_050]
MPNSNDYDVTTWPVGDPAEDIGEVLNSIIADVKSRQSGTDGDGGKPGAVVYLPPGDYRLRTQVLIDISFLKIRGAGHGFTSSSIRFNVPEEEWPDLHELWPGGSRILVDMPLPEDADERAGAAFLVEREGSPRISSVEFEDFCIDGMHFIADGSDLLPENTYVNGKTGVHVASANDSFRFNGMGLVYLEHGLTIHNADALSIHDNFIAECGNCIELRGWGQASKVTDNLIGAGFKGHSIYAEHHGGLLITANNVFPRGASSVRLSSVTRSSITNNRLHSFYPGMVVLAENSSENLIAANHLLRDHEPWTPFLDIDNGLDDQYGLLRVDGSDNTIVSNHFSEVVDSQRVTPPGEAPVIIRLVRGSGNSVATNHVVAKDAHSRSNASAFSGQVDALLATGISQLAVLAVMIDPTAVHNVVLDSGRESEVHIDATANVLRPTPDLAGR